MRYEKFDRQCIREFFGTDIQKVKIWAFFIFISMLIMGCEPVPQGNSNAVSASWDDETETLSVSGFQEASEESVLIHDATNGSLLGSAIVKSDGSWAASSTTSACDVHIDLPSGTATVPVDNAPEDCGLNATARSSGIGSRVATENDIPTGVLVVGNPQPLNAVPNGVILSPPQDLNINVGQTVNFASTVIGTAVAPPFSYFWNFSGSAPNAAIQNPGSIRFDIPGTYFIQLTVVDNLGIPDPTPAVRTITVGGGNFPIGNAPVPVINSPTSQNGSISISVGEQLFFSGSATDTFGSTSFTYEWDFSGAYPDQFGATAGTIPFMTAGTYVVSLYATNPQGVRSATPATVAVNVGAGNGFNQAPSGAIVRPRNDVTIDIGESLAFRARSSDPDNNNPLYYSWDFQGIAPNINMSTDNSAGRVTFNTPGIYYIRMTTTDSLGAMDPNPPVRVVTVQNSVVPPPSGGGNGTLAAQITSPPSDITISPGQSIFFSGQSTNVGAAQYFWSFDGAAANSNLQTPGNITFPLPGQFIVMFYAADFNGNVIGSPATRTITVADPSVVAANIISPADNTTVPLGQAISLVGNTSNNNGFTSLTYQWSIKPRGGGNSIFSSNQLSPGQFVFNQAGEYVVRFKVSGIDQFGNSIVASKTKSRVTVTNVGGVPPIGSPGQGVNSAGIMLPTSDMVIYVGNEVDFEANRFTGTDVTYNWDFNGARRSSSRRNPSAVTFNTPGIFFITLQVSGTQNGLPINVFDQRVITVLQQNPSFPPNNPIVSNTGISLPTTDQVINAGQSVDFEANRISGTNVNYRWDFGGAASPSDSRNPRPKTFNIPGTYFVTLQVTGTSNGLPINIFDQRVITVLQGASGFPPANPFPNNPIAQNEGISRPTTDQVINVGESVDFKAKRFSGTNISYNWNFGGAVPPSTRRNPSPTQFNSAGSFFVTLQVTGTDPNGIPINVFDQRVVTVLQSGAGLPGNNPVQQGPGILLPITDQVINVGDSVDFEANRVSGTNVDYNWNFNGVRSPSTRRDPNSFQFNTPGTFFITLQVSGTDTLGLPINIFDQRVITVLQQAAAFPPSGPTPVGLGSGISAPSADMVINVGDQIDFKANRVSGTNINYSWDFSGVRSPSTRRSPSNVTFNSPGSFLISLRVTGTSNGLPVNIFDQRIITVMQQNLTFPPVPNPVPSPIDFTPGILSPVTDVVINIGDFVDFEADRINGVSVNYNWNFDGAQGQSNRRNPAPVQYNSSGSYLVTMKATGTDANGSPLNAFDQRVVTVLQQVAGFPPVSSPPPGNAPVTSPTPGSGNGPEGYITAPASQFVSVRQGEALQFSGTGFDPLGNGQLSFQWSFGGAARNIVSQNPGFITFNQVGTFVVTLLVQNSFGQVDTTPASVLVQVTQ